MNSFQSTKRAILEMLKHTTFEDNKLPAETELAKRMRVSVVTLRQALTALEAEGYITKKQGIGSFVHTHALDPYLRCDMGDNMIDLVRSIGGTVSVKVKPMHLSQGDERLLQELKLARDEQFVVLEVYYYSDDQPYVIAKNYVPEKYFLKPFTQDDLPTSIDRLIWEYCERILAYELTTWIPRLMPKDLAEVFEVDEGSPLLLWHQTVYDTAETAICGTEAFFNPEFGNPRILRKWTSTPEL